MITEDHPEETVEIDNTKVQSPDAENSVAVQSPDAENSAAVQSPDAENSAASLIEKIKKAESFIDLKNWIGKIF